MEQNISPAKEIAKMTAWVTLFSMVIPTIAIAVIIVGMTRSTIEDSDNVLMVGQVAVYAGTIALMLLTRKNIRSLSSIRIGREKPTPAGVAVCVTAGVAGEGLAVFLLAAFVVIFGIKDDTPDVIIGTNVFLQILAVCVGPPILEEYAMRGLLFAGIRRYKSFVFAAIFSSVVFALLHMNAVGTPWYFVIGFILAYVYEKKHSLVLNMILHAAVNLTATLLSIIPGSQSRKDTSDLSQIDNQTVIALLVAGLICTGIVLLCMYYFKKSAVAEGDFYGDSSVTYLQQPADPYANRASETYIFKNGAYYKTEIRPGEYVAGIGGSRQESISRPDENGYVTVRMQGKEPVKIKICTGQSE